MARGGVREGAGRKVTGRKKKTFYITDEENTFLRKCLEYYREHPECDGDVPAINISEDALTDVLLAEAWKK